MPADARFDQPYLLDVITLTASTWLPFIPAGHTVADMIYEK